jgi:molybdate transport system ATP-binding protein
MSEQTLQVDIQKKLKNFMLDIRFQAKEGCLGILGSSGCGKSMTLKSIAGVVTPDSGQILLEPGNRILYDSAERINVRPQKRRVGYLFQNYALFPNMTVEQNILVGVGKEDKKLLQDMIGLFHLEGLEKQYPAQLSGGQQQRVALARILAYQPDLLLFDEPFSAMDAFLREGLRLELLHLLERYGGISVLVTHDRDEAYQLCDHLLLMDEGKVLAAGETKEIFDAPKTLKTARLTGCKNFSKIEKVSSHRVRALDWDGLELTTAEEVTADITHVGIRAHDLLPLSAAEGHELLQDPASTDNLVRVEDPVVSEMPFEWYVTLKNGIWWKWEKNMHSHATEGWMPAFLQVDPKSVLLLREDNGCVL